MKAEAVTNCKDCPFVDGAYCSKGSDVDLHSFNGDIPKDCPVPIMIVKVEK